MRIGLPHFFYYLGDAFGAGIVHQLSKADIAKMDMAALASTGSPTSEDALIKIDGRGDTVHSPVYSSTLSAAL